MAKAAKIRADELYTARETERITAQMLEFSKTMVKLKEIQVIQDSRNMDSAFETDTLLKRQVQRYQDLSKNVEQVTIDYAKQFRLNERILDNMKRQEQFTQIRQKQLQKEVELVKTIFGEFEKGTAKQVGATTAEQLLSRVRGGAGAIQGFQQGGPWIVTGKLPKYCFY